MKTALHRSSGIALVVTLILLAIITFMTVTFLVLSRAQKNSVAATLEKAKADEMAKLSLRRGLAEVLGPVKAFNLGAVDIRVSTNFINYAGFQRGQSFAYPGIQFNPLNVNYADANGVPLTGNDYLQNLLNLYYSPRAPVYVPTNRLVPGAYDFRWYVDLNRNGRFETNGWLPEFNDLLQPITALDAKGNQYIPLKFFVGDPEWIGVLEKPEYHHSPTNLFVGRYAYIILPASKTLDLNYAHNYSKGVNVDPSGSLLRVNPSDLFMRNQGATTFEMNLAAFLADLNTNYWPLARNPIVNSYWWPTPNRPPYAPPYAYSPFAGQQPNGGWAFTHATGLVRYRYANNQNNLLTVNNLFGSTGYTAVANSFIDGFSAGPLMTNTWWPGDAVSMAAVGWPGSYNPYHFYTHQDLFDTNKTTTVSTPFNVTTVLESAGAGSNSYNRYTFYRMLAQLGTDTGPGDPENAKININYANVDGNGNIVPDLATNFLPWVPEQFFTNTVNRLLNKAGYTFGINNIQIYPTNYYTASVHRLLQLTANIYDATTSNTFPTVLRPVFKTTHTNGTQVFIVGYHELTPAEHQFLAGIGAQSKIPNMCDLTVSNFPVNITDMVKGVPLVIGAKKWFPNFNELELRTEIETTRKLEFRKRLPTDPAPYATNQMYLLSITNHFGLEAWNSYTNAYPRPLQMTVAVEITATLSNQFGALVYSNTMPFSNYLAFGTNMQIQAGSWTGYNPLKPAYSFLTPYTSNNAHFSFLLPASYSTLNNQLITPYQTTFETGQGFPVPEWWLNLKTSMRFILFDQTAGRIVDYVNLQNVNPSFNITTNLSYVPPAYAHTGSADGYYGNMFLTNRVGGNSVFSPTYGVINQINASLGQNSNHLVWNSSTATVPAGWDTQGAINFFRTNLLHLPPIGGKFVGPLFLTNRFYSPYNPTRDLFVYTSWQANDPLVHYTIGDLTPLLNTNACDYDKPEQTASTIGNIGVANSRYEPWPGDSLASAAGPTLTDLRVKDPFVTRSSDWDFPTNKLANPGWLGRIHRGTPWQTVYLKSAPVDIGTWQNWTGNGAVPYNDGRLSPSLVALKNYYQDAWITHPTNDWRLLDMFTTAFSDSSMRGQLSINQTNLAAWSAALAGVAVNPSNNLSYIIQPAGAYSPTSPPPLITIYNAINDVRRTNFAGSFSRLGDILAVPELTVRSPFLISSNITDAVLERIPQQVLGLLKGGEQPRFVVYCYGQALKPADRSRVTSGPFLDLCTNYQITAETATRAVVRIEGAPGNPRAIIESYNVLPPD